MKLKITNVRAVPGDSAFLLDDGATAKVEKLDVEYIFYPSMACLALKGQTFIYPICRRSAVETANGIVSILKNGGTHDDVVAYVRDTFYRGNIPSVYPEDTMLLNTNIVVRLVEKELLGQQ